ncbi:hypothetical protein CONPUDRAFT_163863 [Coniophora puteana RWD-64-598 SS2]|uniref:Uncharacterized protein n=1 Tax=Coniophora puteana (strain RWD-64-598) TaxID=741705 RepID=A0A5M3MUS4_CONPW|nr:uncharacterized protein CONPUDRAFT_163863 [Coniophora puteana RWD-64-598 SS2]EIW82790.1 hypothetical protein CONPUDRAFT_163863 [Coniophora puteana RWD-64-598 SS2]
MIVREIAAGSTIKFRSIKHFDVTTYARHRISLVIVGQNEKDRGEPPAVTSLVKVDILRLIEADYCGATVHLEELYQHTVVLNNLNIVPKLDVSPSPNALVVQWRRGPKALLWNIDDLSSEPITLIHHSHEPNDHAPSYITCRTHLLSFLDSGDMPSLDEVIITAAPLDDVFTCRSMRPTARGIIPGDLAKIQVLRDSVVDTRTGVTEVILSAHEAVFHFDFEDSYFDHNTVVIRLCIPFIRAGDAQANLIVEVHHLLALPPTSRDAIIGLSWNGCTRLAVAFPVGAHSGEGEPDERGKTQIKIAEAEWDEEAQQVSCRAAEDVLVYDVSKKVEEGRAMLRFFESEIGSGKLIFEDTVPVLGKNLGITT